MALYFNYSFSLESLLVSMVDDLKASGLSDSFIGHKIYIPNKNLKRWLSLELSKSENLGITFNNTYLFLEEGIIDLIKSFDKEEKSYTFLGYNEQLLDLQLLILKIIQSNKDLVMMNKYINSGSQSENSEAKDKLYAKRSWQLSEKLAFYFREYEYQREEMIDTWQTGKQFTEGIPDFLLDIEREERLIYQEVFQAIKDINSSGDNDKTYITLPGYADEVFKKNNLDSSSFNSENRSIYLFGFNQISEFHYRMLLKMSNAYDIHLYQLNFLDNIMGNPGVLEAPLEIETFYNNIKSLEKDNETGLLIPDENENSLVKKWAVASRDNIYRFSETVKESDYQNIKLSIDIDYDISNDTLLHKLQNSLINKKIDKKNKQDKSLQIYGAPDRIREIEAIYNNIFYNLENDESLKITDIAILAPDLTGYINLIQMVFNRSSARNLPYNMTDRKTRDESLFINGLIDALELSSKNFNRTDVIELLCNPIIISSIGGNRDMVPSFVKWIDKLNIFRGYEDDKNTVFSWHRAFQRLRFGRIMEKSVSDHSEVRIFNGILPYSDMECSEEDVFNTFVFGLERLFERLIEFSKLGSEGVNGEKWSEKLTDFIKDFFIISEEFPQEEIDKNALLRNIAKLKLFDELYASDTSSIDFTYVIEFIKSNVQKATRSYGRYLADGVTIAELTPMRPIPFKIVYIIGMNEHDYPGRKDQSSLDLRNAKQKIGDINPGISSRYLLLETLMSAKEKLYISYVNRNTKREQELFPSLLVVELMDYINQFVIDEKKYEPLSLPLKGESERYITDDTICKNKHFDIGQNKYILAQRLSSLLKLRSKGYFGMDSEAARKIIEKADVYLKKFSDNQLYIEPDSIENSNTSVNTDSKDEVYISLYILEKFLKDSLSVKLESLLKLEKDDNDVELELKKYQPYISRYPMEYPLKSELEADIFRCITGHNDGATDIDEWSDNVQESFINRYEFYKNSGQEPTGVFFDFDEKRKKKELQEKYIENDNFNDFVRQVSSDKYYKKVIFSKSMTTISDDGSIVLPPLEYVLSGGDGVEKHAVISGSYSNVFVNDDEVNLVSFVNKLPKDKRKHIIKPFLFATVLTALVNKEYDDNDNYITEFKNKKIICTFFTNSDKKSIVLYDKSAEESEADGGVEDSYIRDLVLAVMNSKNYDFIPGELLLSDAKGKNDDFTRDSVYKKIIDSESDYYNSFKLPDCYKLLDIESMIPENIDRIFSERYGKMLGLL